MGLRDCEAAFGVARAWTDRRSAVGGRVRKGARIATECSIPHFGDIRDLESVFAMSSKALANGGYGGAALRQRRARFPFSARGTIEIGGFAVNRMKTLTDAQAEDADLMERHSVNPPNVYGFGHQVYYEHVVDCIRQEQRHLVDGLEGRKSLELISAIYESVETGREVRLRFRPKCCRLGGK